MTSRVQSQCTPSCARYLSPFNPANTAGVKACAAFPGGIPDRIWNNELDHRQPVDGDHGLQWLANEGYEFPVYAFAPEALGQGTVVAALELGEEHTGAMVALLPADPDELAVDGGEPVDQLHCTVLFLGEAADIPPDVRERIVAAARGVAEGWGDIEADGFALSMFNPLGEEPCIVLGLSGVDLADFHDAIDDVITPPVDQHQPWVPHITLIYTDDPAQMAGLIDRTGPVVFDRLRVVFGDDITDIPLVEEEDFTPDDDGVPETPPEEGGESEAPEAPEVASGRVRWDGCPRCFDPVHTGPCTTVAV